MSLRRGAARCARTTRRATWRRPAAPWPSTSQAMLELQARGRRHLRLRQQHPRPGARRRASRTPSTSPASCRPTSGRCSARARARSAGPRSPATRRTSRPPTRPSCELFPEDEALGRWIRLAREQVAFQGLPARICWLGYGERAKVGLAFNELVRSGRGQGPDRDRPRPPRRGSVASPNRETEGMRDGSDAIADWPILNALLNAVAGRHLGLGPPRRRRRHRLLHPRRHGDRRRRHAGGGRGASSAC